MSKGKERVREQEAEIKRLRREAEDEREKVSRKVEICQQMMLDAYCFAVHDLFGVGKGRMEHATQVFKDRYFELVTLIRKDERGEGDGATGDPEFVYAQETIDNGLREIVPESLYCPWNERYYNSTQFHRIPRSQESLLRQAAMFDKMAEICREQALFSVKDGVQNHGR